MPRISHLISRLCCVKHLKDDMSDYKVSFHWWLDCLGKPGCLNRENAVAEESFAGHSTPSSLPAAPVSRPSRNRDIKERLGKGSLQDMYKSMQFYVCKHEHTNWLEITICEKFKKINDPMSWKQSDLKIQSTVLSFKAQTIF